MISNIILSIIFAIAVTVLIKAVKFIKTIDSSGKGLIISSFWIKVVLNTAIFTVNIVEENLVRSFRFNTDITQYIRFFISDFFQITTLMINLGIVLILRRLVENLLNNRFSANKLPQDETVLFDAGSTLAIKIEKICKKVFLYGSLAITIINLYDALENVLMNTDVFDIDFYYGDVSDIYYVLNDIPDAIAGTLFFMICLMVIISLICIFTKNHLKITNKKVYGTANFCQKISTELYKITEVEPKNSNGIVIRCGLKNISLFSIENRDEAVKLLKENISEKVEEQIEIEEKKECIIVNPLLKQAYRNLSTIAILNVITFGIYQYVWIYKMTNELNLIDAKDQRDPVNKLLLCLFIPMYTIWWFYKSTAAIKKLEDAANIKSDIGVLCPVFSVFCPLIAMLMLQDNLNEIIK